MTDVKLISFCGLLLLCSAIAKQIVTCGQNEIKMDCASECRSDYCPKSADDNQSCHEPKNCIASGCKCIIDHRRAENGTCIDVRQCPPFKCTGPFEEYQACPPACSDDCSQATPSGECPPTFGLILVFIPCSPSCRCTKGHWRMNGKCVPYAHCRK